MKNKTNTHWFILALCCALAASSVGLQSNSYGVFCSVASQSLGVGQGTYSLHQTLSNLFMGLFSPLALSLTKKNGLNKSIWFGVVIVALGTAAMGIGNNMIFFYAMAIMRGFGNSFLAVAMVNIVVNNWFIEKHGFATGLTMSFSGLSGAIFSPLFTSLMSSIGWRSTYFVMAVITVILVVPAALFLKFTPEEMGLLPYGADENFERQAEVQNKVKATFTMADVFPIVLLVIFTVSWNMLSGFTQYFVGYSESLGFTAALGATMVSACMIGNVVFKLLIGVLSDRIGPIYSCVSIACVTLLGLVLLNSATAMTSTIFFMIAAFLFGGQYSVGVVGISLLTNLIFSRERFDTIFPYLNIAIYVGGAFSLTIIGNIYDTTSSYAIAMYALMAFMVVDIIIIFILNHMRRGVEE